MTTHPVIFCTGCGDIFDQPEHGEEDGRWVKVHDYEIRHGVTWKDLALSHTFCPDCLVRFRTRPVTQPERRTLTDRPEPDQTARLSRKRERP